MQQERQSLAVVILRSDDAVQLRRPCRRGSEQEVRIAELKQVLIKSKNNEIRPLYPVFVSKTEVSMTASQRAGTTSSGILFICFFMAARRALIRALRSSLSEFRSSHLHLQEFSLINSTTSFLTLPQRYCFWFSPFISWTSCTLSFLERGARFSFHCSRLRLSLFLSLLCKKSD